MERLFVIVVICLFFSACIPDPMYPEEPAIEFKSINTAFINQFTDSLFVVFEFTDGETVLIRVPAQIWSRNNLKTSKVYQFDKQVVSVILDPFLETADCDTENNYWPRRAKESRFELYKRSYYRSRSNPMQQE